MKEISPFNKLSYFDLNLIKYVLDDYTQYGTSKNYEDLKITIKSMMFYYHHTLNGEKMLCYKDKIYCVSPDCKNECGRQLTKEIRQAAIKADMPISQGYFCGDPVGGFTVFQALEEECFADE